ncbi:hypothetical protein M419DRAFT_125009 [Trichoderma reesei RUT C-30]|uniref:Uncharacterized protein n=1 Tax=Hypocrea jecorina (strain ATCC 56765 / BCRC 32924 / NRRL 11460 / Rut C-30) TaxID=1344414 RepID=A0A024RXZ6_HYPJR|nr:hypothetical protein M419DRAFT_125009 [Trichoderma reesei RUT C-30]
MPTVASFMPFPSCLTVCSGDRASAGRHSRSMPTSRRQPLARRSLLPLVSLISRCQRGASIGYLDGSRPACGPTRPRSLITWGQSRHPDSFM